jgi:hypothetical protein
MALPFEPESLAQLQARFAQALSPVYDVASEGQATMLGIGKKRKHVFDCENGIRAIVSLDRNQAGETLLHISFSTTGRSIPPQEAVDLCHELAETLSQGRLVKPEVRVTEKGIIHFFYPPWSIVHKLNEVERAHVATDWAGLARIQ